MTFRRALLSVGLIWLLLVTLTFVSAEGLAGRKTASVAILLIAAAKAGVIGAEFMELRHAHRGIALAFCGWLAVVTAMLCWFVLT